MPGIPRAGFNHGRLVREPEWRDLFTDQERAVAHERLEAGGYFQGN